ncbi:MAG: peptidase S41, partial [Bacteroidota bacterium]
MKKIICSCFILFFCLHSYAQQEKKIKGLNLDFEILENGKPKGWNNFGGDDYLIALDSNQVKSGKYSVSIESKAGAADFKAWSFTLPDNYKGSKITLSGYIKTENVSEGHAGLWMRIDPGIAFDNMARNGIKGTTDWTKYEVTLDMQPDITKQIVIGGLLVGKGKMWLDDLKVMVNRKDIKGLKPYIRPLVPAEKDSAFAQGSGIESITSSQRQIEDLRVLGLIWGFLKYYHPQIAQGKYNWDNELFRLLPELLKAENLQKRDEMLVQWIDRLGEMPEGKAPDIKSSSAKLVPDLDWIQNFNFSSELQTILLKVKN